MFSMTRRSLALATMLSVAALAGCSGKGSSSTHNGPAGSARIAVGGSALVQADVVSMNLSISGTGYSAFTVPMSKNTDGNWTGYASSIPAGSTTFTVNALNSANTLVYTGVATATVTTGATADVYLMLQQVLPPNQFGNHAPVIDSLTTSAGLTKPGTDVALSITAHDPDDASPTALSYQWAVSCTGGAPTGSFAPAGGAAANVVWTAPNTPGLDTYCTLTVKTTDSCASLPHPVSGAVTTCASSALAAMQIHVFTQQEGNANVNAYPNTCPVITCVAGTQEFSYNGNAVTGYVVNPVSVTAIDVDGDTMTYQYSSDCGGTFAAGAGEVSASSSNFTSGTVNACAIRVDVKDYWPAGTKPDASLPDYRGCDNAGLLTFGAVTDFAVAPLVSNVIQPNTQNQVQPGQTYTFGANIVNPNGGTYNGLAAGGTSGWPIAWAFTASAGAGTFSGPTSGSLSADGQVSIQWTAPSPLVANMKVTLTLTNAFNQVTTQVFKPIPANACALAGSDGQPCDDGNPCTQNDTCQAGACKSGPVMSCTASDSCHASACQTVGGAPQCVETALTGTPCPSGAVCTVNEICNSGVCQGTTYVCPGQDACHTIACVEGSGGCQAAQINVGATCNDNNLCTSGDQCQTNGSCAGTAIAAPTVACKVTVDGLGQPTGTCNPATGWLLGNAANGTACDDGKFCSLTDWCQAGACVQQTAACAAPNTCSEGTTGPVCNPPAAPNGLLIVDNGTSPAVGISGLAYDLNGFIYEAGSNFQPGADLGCGLINSAGSADAFVAKIDPSTGKCTGLWAKDFGDSANDQTVTQVAANRTSVAFAGQYFGLMSLGGTASITNNAITRDFVGALDQAGAPLWVKEFDLNDGAATPTYGKINSIAGTLVTAKSAGSRYAICGYVGNKALSFVNGTPATEKCINCANGGGLDAFVAVLDGASGDVLWARQFGGAGDQTCNAVAFDDNGDVVISGTQIAAMTIGTVNLVAPPGSNRWVFVAKFDGSNGDVSNAVAFGNGATTSRDTPRAIATAPDASVVVGGQFQGGLTAAGTTITATGTSFDMFVMKLDSNLNATWLKRAGGTAPDDVRGVAVDSYGQVYVAGVFDGTLTTTWNGAATIPTAGSTDVLLARLDPATGNQTFELKAGDAYGQEPRAMVVTRLATGANQDTVFVGGDYTSSIQFPGVSNLSSGSTTTAHRFLLKMK
jgi:hypothetical protein